MGIRYSIQTPYLDAPVTRISAKHTADRRYRFISIGWDGNERHNRAGWDPVDGSGPAVFFHTKRPRSRPSWAKRFEVVEINAADFEVL